MATTKSMSMSIPSPLRLSGGSMPSSPISPTSPSPPRSSSSSISQHSHTKSSMFPQPFSPKSSSSGGEDTKFRLSNLLLQHYNQNQSQNHQERQRRQEYGSEGTVQQQRPSRHHHHFFSSKHETGFKERTHQRGGFLGFLQSHYHVFHRHTDSTGKGIKERESELTSGDSSVPQSPGGSFISTVDSKSPQSTVHSAYNVTISDFRAHGTIGSTRSGGSPKYVTDIVFERRAFGPMTTLRGTSAQDSDGQSMISPPISSSSSVSTKGARSVTTTPRDDLRDTTGVFRSSFRSLGMLNLASSPSSSVSPLPLPTPSTSTPHRPPPSPSFGAWAKAYEVGPHVTPPNTNTNAISSSSPRSSGHERSDQAGSTSSKNSSSKWGMSAKLAFMNLKKKQPTPLPGHYLSLPVGGSTSSANALYMLHSEDLSVTEFAKLAGITILSEDDTTDTRTQEEFANGSEGEGPGPAFDSGDTVNSDRHPTFNSLASDSSFHRKVNIWEPQFWTMPSRDGSTGTHTPLTSASTTSLPIQTAPSTPRSSERRNSYRSEAPTASPGSSRRTSMTPSSSGVLSSSVPIRTPPSVTRTGYHDTTQTVGPSLQVRRNSCSPGLILSSPGQDSDRSRPPSASMRRDHAKASKEAAQFSSLTAIAIELDSDHELETRAQRSLALDMSETLSHNSILQNGHHPITVKTEASNISLETSNPPGIPGILSPQPRPVSSRSQSSPRMRGHPSPFSSSLRSGPSTKTRSPSPSPLSRQIGASESIRGDDRDKQEASVSISREGQDQESQDPSRDRGVGEEEGDGQGHRQHVDPEMPTPLLHNRTHSLPLLLSDPDHKPSSQGIDPARPNNSSPGRLLVPGMKVGRFTLVQEMCTKHVDILKAQQEQLRVQRCGSLDSQMGGPSNSDLYSSLKDDGSHTVSSSSSEGGHGSEATGDSVSWSNPMLRPEENVMVFQRKKARRLVPPSQPSRQD
ncbi:hypothetical protein CPB97_002880 [Podila verticillata]|nr:hypothetical protein CPB97_002880 [Podila verticillata]